MKMIFSVLLLVCSAAVNCGVAPILQRADFVSKKHVTCLRTFSKIGCFRKSSSPNMKLLINDQDPKSEHNAGYLTDMSNFAKSTHSLACRCASRAVREGYTYFSIRFWGQCFVGKDYKNVQKMVDDPKTHKSPDCANPKYQACNDKHAHECIAWENADYIYSIYGASPNDPNIDGGYDSWTKWTKCSKACGDGVISRERTCTKPIPKGKGRDCAHLGPSSETKPCKIKECRIDGGYTEWSKFSICSRSCGGGVSRRTRHCTDPRPLNGGAHCKGADMESQKCQPQPCPVHGGYSQWSAYGACTATCGLGQRTRVRLCNNPTPAHGGRKCGYLGNAEETTPCNIRRCPIDGGYTNWMPFSHCTKTCGTGQKRRVRICSRPAPAFGGKPCPGRYMEVEDCNTDPCPINGGWAPYSAWQTCSVSCGGGITRHHRTCTNPSPDHGGDDCAGPTHEKKVCNTQECPINGGFTEWSQFDECSASCAGGVKIRTRTCTNPSPQYGGAPCSGPTTNNATCNTHHCPINGGYSDYGPWAKCTKSCGGGTQIRKRYCNNPKPRYGGRNCLDFGSPSEWRDCETQPCARYTKFGPWSKCSKSCAGGVQKRSRTCYAPGWTGRVSCAHLGSATETRPCETQKCPINGGWGPWTRWEPCSKTCGNGYKSKSRKCNNPVAQYGGRGCPGYVAIRAHCHLRPCPIDGKWTRWGRYKSCSKPCGGGIQKRTRECGNPRPQHGGKKCPGATFTTRACNKQPCPIDGGFTKWTAWRACSESCGGGRTHRLRFCTNPRPKYGGDQCVGARIQAKRCGTKPCPINGGWSAYGAFGSCSVSCGGGKQVSVRHCNSPLPQYNGAKCLGEGIRNKPCNTHPCPIDGKYSEWSEFGRCSYSCDGGTQSRSRKCTPPKYGGKTCASLGNAVDYRECNTQLCPVKVHHVAIGCEGMNATLNQCTKGGGLIHILAAEYGRTKHWICGNVEWWDFNCRAPHGSGKKVVKPLCEGKKTCSVPSSDKLFGDPCKLTHKYLEIMYQCYGGRYPDLADEDQ